MARKTLEPLTIDALLHRSAAQFADNVALGTVEQATPLTFAQLDEQVHLLQAKLDAAGIVAGDKVALFSENMPNWAVIYLAVTTMGAVIVPILTEFHDNEVRHIIRHAECRAVFVSHKLRDVLIESPSEQVVLVMRSDTLEPDEALSHAEHFGRLQRSLQTLGIAARAMLKRRLSHPVTETDLAAIIYTSGTTGSSKGVMLTHRALAYQAIAAQSVYDVEPEDRFLSILPLAHTFECSVGLLIPLFNGACVYYLNRPPTPRILIDAMAKVRPTAMLSVPLVIEKIYKNRIQPSFGKNVLIRLLYRIAPIRRLLHRLAGRKLLATFGGELRFFGIGGAPLSPVVETFLREARFPYAIGYGLTETAPLLAGGGPFRTKARAIGPALEGITIRIEDPNAAGEGTIVVKGPNVMIGYYKNPDKTAEVLSDEGWFNTEDLGYFDDDGYLYLSGRSKNVILGPSGENIYPEQIEAMFTAHPLVEDALVYEDQIQLHARIHLDYEKLDQRYGIKKLSEKELHAKIESLLNDLKTEVNAGVAKFSRISRIIEQREPFVKTPTKKIKRYLYTQGAK